MTTHPKWRIIDMAEKDDTIILAITIDLNKIRDTMSLRYNNIKKECEHEDCVADIDYLSTITFNGTFSELTKIVERWDTDADGTCFAIDNTLERWANSDLIISCRIISQGR